MGSMEQARAFAAGYATAIKLLARKLDRYALAVEILEEGIRHVPAWFETWEITQDPEFQESLGQVMRGEGREIEPEEFDG